MNIINEGTEKVSKMYLSNYNLTGLFSKDRLSMDKEQRSLCSKEQTFLIHLSVMTR